MAQRTVLITGISGFIAQNLALRLTKEGRSVFGIGRTPPTMTGLERCGFRAVDIRDFSVVLAIIAEVRPHSIYHLAAQSVLTTGGDEGAQGTLATNVSGTANILEGARRMETPVVVVASSDKQYGALAAPPYDDNDASAFINGGLYELSKAQQDQTARLYAGLYDTPAIRVARLVNIYGPGDTNHSRIIPGTIRRSLIGERPRLTAGPAGAALREYLFVDDAIVALRALAKNAEAKGNAPYRTANGKLATVGFNIASPHRQTAGEVIVSVQTALRENFGIETLPADEQPGPTGIFEPGHQFNRDEKLRRLLPAWSPRTLSAGLLDTIPWYLANKPK